MTTEGHRKYRSNRSWALACALGGVLVVLGTPAFAERYCAKSSVKGTSPPGPIPYLEQSAANNAAIGNWTGNAVAANNYAGAGDWMKAKQRRTTCNKLATGFGGFVWKCTVQGIPCWDIVN
jgi:hypothetical protein